MKAKPYVFIDMNHDALMISEIGKLQENNMLTDVAIGKELQNSIQCHKIMLASTSEHFERLFTKTEPCTENDIVIVNSISSQTLTEIVEFIYKQECSINDKNIDALLKQSVHWRLIDLNIECNRRLINVENAVMYYNITADKCVSGKQISEKEFEVSSTCLYECCKLINEYAANIIRKHYTYIFKKKQLSLLSMERFLHILTSNKVNVKNEDTLCESVISWVEDNFPSSLDITRLFDIIRWDKLSVNYLKEIQEHPSLDNFPEMCYIRNALDAKVRFNQSRKSKGHTYEKNCKIVTIDVHSRIQTFEGHIWTVVMSRPSWCDGFTATSTYGHGRLILAGSKHTQYGKYISLLDLQNFCEIPLPVLPEPVYAVSALEYVNSVFVVGGRTYKNGISNLDNIKPSGRWEWSANMRWLCMSGENKWESMTPMLYAVTRPIMSYVNKQIIVLGGNSNQAKNVRHTQVYDMQSAVWKRGASIPQGCTSLNSGAIVNEEKVFLFTSKSLLIYDPDLGTWETKDHGLNAERVKPILIDKQIVLFVWDGKNTLPYIYSSDTEAYDILSFDTSLCRHTSNIFSL